MIVVATDAPLTSRQIGRVTRRAALGLARTGATARNGSGDMLIGFSTGNLLCQSDDVHTIRTLNNQVINPLFEAVIEATEEAILNAITCAHTMTGRDGNTAYEIPLCRLVEVLEAYGRKSRDCRLSGRRSTDGVAGTRACTSAANNESNDPSPRPAGYDRSSCQSVSG